MSTKISCLKELYFKILKTGLKRDLKEPKLMQSNEIHIWNNLLIFIKQNDDCRLISII